MAFPVNSKLKQDIGLRVTQCREKKFGKIRGSKALCAKLLRVSPGELRDLEAGRAMPRADKIAELAYFFDVDPGWLLTGRGPTGENPPESPSRDHEIQRELSEAFPRFLDLVGRAQCAALERCDMEARGWLALMQSMIASLQDYVGTDDQTTGSKKTSSPPAGKQAG